MEERAICPLHPLMAADISEIKGDVKTLLTRQSENNGRAVATTDMVESQLKQRSEKHAVINMFASIVVGVFFVVDIIIRLWPKG